MGAFCRLCICLTQRPLEGREERDAVIATAPRSLSSPDSSRSPHSPFLVRVIERIPTRISPVHFLLGVCAVLLVCALLPIFVMKDASAQPGSTHAIATSSATRSTSATASSRATTPTTLRFDGSSFGPEFTHPQSQQQEVASLPAAPSSTASTAPTVLGAPFASEPTVLGLECPAFLCNWKLFEEVVSAKFACELAPVGYVLDITGIKNNNILSRCVEGVIKVITMVVGWVVNELVMQIMQPMTRTIAESAAWIVKWTLESVLGDNPVISAQLLCMFNEGKNTSCSVGWLVSQLDMMRQIGLFIMIPLALMLCILAVIKGSLFLLLRGMLIMMPVAFLGGIVIIVLAQLLMTIVDEACAAMTNYVMPDTNLFISRYSQAVSHAGGILTSVASSLWLLVTIIACIVIIVELFIREFGIYLSALFIPLAFAMLIYPHATKWARRFVEILIGFIFMKLFMVGSLLLAISALMNDTVLSFGQGDVTEQQSVTVSITGAAMFMFAAFATKKMMAPLPAGMDDGSDRVVNTGSFWGAGEQFQNYLGKAQNFLTRKSGGMKGKQNMVNAPRAGGNGSGNDDPGRSPGAPSGDPGRSPGGGGTTGRPAATPPPGVPPRGRGRSPAPGGRQGNGSSPGSNPGANGNGRNSPNRRGGNPGSKGNGAAPSGNGGGPRSQGAGPAPAPSPPPPATRRNTRQP